MKLIFFKNIFKGFPRKIKTSNYMQPIRKIRNEIEDLEFDKDGQGNLVINMGLNFNEISKKDSITLINLEFDEKRNISFDWFYTKTPKIIKKGYFFRNDIYFELVKGFYLAGISNLHLGKIGAYLDTNSN